MTVEAALSLLEGVVQEMYAQARRATAAGVKSRMRHRSDRSFDERALGYASFRDFLEDAQTRGLVAVHHGGVDVLVTPPDKQPPPVEPACVTDDTHDTDTTDAGPRRVQHHLWRTFVDWTPGLLRTYDRVEQQAFMLPVRPSPREPSENRARRQMLEEDGARFVSIDPIPFEVQLGWMHDFTDLQGSPIKEQLQLALGSQRPARDFTGQIRTAPALNNGWHRHLVDEVVGVITRWAEAHDLQVEIFVPLKGRTPTTSDVHSRPTSSTLRAVLHRAIDRMPEHELMAIKLPVGYLIETGDPR